LAHASAALYSRAWVGKLPPLTTLLEQAMPNTERPKTEFLKLSKHLGIAPRKLSPEAKAALERMRARG
jgi:hypothetical protein